jgi:hypothetical protein
MNSPSDTIQGSPTFHYKIEKVEGGFKCSNVSLGPHIEPVVREDEQAALRAAKMATEAWMGKGSGTQK